MCNPVILFNLKMMLSQNFVKQTHIIFSFELGTFIKKKPFFFVLFNKTPNIVPQ